MKYIKPIEIHHNLENKSSSLVEKSYVTIYDAYSVIDVIEWWVYRETYYFVHWEVIE